MSTASDTIVAVSSPAGRSSRAIIRLSGPHADAALARLSRTDRAQLKPAREFHAVKLDFGAPDPLPCLAVRFAEPRSFTGEAMVELQIPGNPALVDRVLRACLAVDGVRLAQPGEFSFRAYLRGKIDLTQAEGIAATIAAQTDAQLAAAALLRKGRLGDLAAALVQQVAEALALVEAGIDFTDQDDVVPIAPRDLTARVSQSMDQLAEVLQKSRSWGTLRTLPRVVLVGAPSSGKSTLFNALLGADRAVTSHAPGTTRDVLEETIDLPATPASPIASQAALLDIAGLDTPQGELEGDIQSAAREAMASADLLLLVTPADAARRFVPETDHAQSKPVIEVLTKCDLIRVAPLESPQRAAIAVSAQKNLGLDALRESIADHLAGAAGSLAAESLALQPRHEESLRAAHAALAQAMSQITPQSENRHLSRPEVIAGSLRLALDSLACLGGTMTPDDVIGLVFARFCVGK